MLPDVFVQIINAECDLLVHAEILQLLLSLQRIVILGKRRIELVFNHLWGVEHCICNETCIKVIWQYKATS